MQYDDEPIPTSKLECAECGTVASPDAKGWKAYLGDDGGAFLFCPDCGEREFPEE